MHMTVNQAQSRVSVTILAIHGDLDASNFEDLIAKAQELYQAGSRYLLLDLSDMRFMSSSGLVALHSVTLLMRGEKPLDREAGWQAFHAIEQSRDTGVQQLVMLLNPQPNVNRTLQITGMNEFLAIHTDMQTAIDSFTPVG